jgi:hypothetical protein
MEKNHHYINQERIERLRSIYHFIEFYEYLKKERKYVFQICENFKYKVKHKALIRKIINKPFDGDYIVLTNKEWLQKADLLKAGFNISFLPFDSDLMRIKMYMRDERGKQTYPYDVPCKVLISVMMPKLPWWAKKSGVLYHGNEDNPDYYLNDLAFFWEHSVATTSLSVYYDKLLHNKMMQMLRMTMMGDKKLVTID